MNDAAIVYFVEQSCAGMWEVRNFDFIKPIASFANKRDALDYACKLAQLKPNAYVAVRD